MNRRQSILAVLLAPFAFKRIVTTPPIAAPKWIPNPEWKTAPLQFASWEWSSPPFNPSEYIGQWQFVGAEIWANPRSPATPPTLSSVTSRKLEGTVPQKSDTRPVKAPVPRAVPQDVREGVPRTLEDRTP